MSIERLQAAIREKKTPVALGLAPEIDKVPAKILKNFEDMFGPGMMANAEALRFHGCQAMDAAREQGYPRNELYRAKLKLRAQLAAC